MERTAQSPTDLMSIGKRAQTASGLFSSESVLDLLKLILAGSPLPEVLAIIAQLVEYALLTNVIVAAEGATFHDLPHFAGGIVPGDGIFTAWSYRAGAARAEAFLLNPHPLTAQTAYAWGVVAEVVPNGKALARARELASIYLKAPGSHTPQYTCALYPAS